MNARILLWRRAAFAVLFSLLLSVAGLTNATAQTFTVGNLNYSINEDGASVTVTGHVDGTSATGELVIPESVELYGTTYPVTVIGHSAFPHCTGLTGSLVIPNSVVTIGPNAFLGCSGFTELILGNAVQTIDSYAFQYCHSFTGALTIPESVTYINYDAFMNCEGFTSLNYNSVNCSVNSSGWISNNSSLVTLNIGENVQVIPSNFLKNHTCFIGELIIPESVTSIGNDAFTGCTGFNSLAMGNSVTSIGNYAFNGCSGFTGSLNLGNSITSIGENAFNGCSGFTGSLIIPNSVSNISTNAFSGCSGFSGTLTIGNSVTQIGNSAFFGACEGFTSFDVKPETPPTLGTNVFTSANYDIPVQVPCGSLDAYQNASGWNNFTNIQEPNPCMWEIAVTANPAEGGTVSGGGTFEQGTTCTLTATPAEYYIFVNWTEDGIEVSTDAEYSFTVESDRNLVAHFEMPVFTIMATANPSFAGEITGASSIENFDFEDNQIPANWINSSYPWTVTTSAYEGYNGSFCMRSGNNGVASSTSAIETTVEFVANGSISFLALCMGEGTYIAWDKCQFFIDGEEQFCYGAHVSGWNTYSYEVSAGTHTFKWSYTKDGSINPTGDAFFIDDVTFTTGIFHLNETCTLTATPSSDAFVFSNWTENGEVVLTDAQYTFTVTENHQLVANFIQVIFDITATANPEEGGTISGTGSYQEGQTCTLTATPNEDYAFVNWTENGVELSTDIEYTFVVTGSRDLVANFVLSTYTITATPNPIEGGTVNFGQGPRFYDFEDGTLQGWTSIDADGDGYNWITGTEVMGTGYGHNGSNGLLLSQSYDNNYGVLYPDNYLVSPQIVLGGSITFYACAQDANYAAEHFGVAVSTNSNTNPNDFTTIQEWTMTAKGYGAPTNATRSGNRAQGNWYEYTVDLSAYAGQSGYVALRHFNCSDMFFLDVDDISISQPGTSALDITSGSTCTLNAIPNYGYAFDSWTENNEVFSTDVTYSFIVSGNRDLVANFVKVPFSITATPNFEDRGTVSGTGEYVIDTICTLTATPAEGHSFLRWLENGQEVSTDAEYTFIVAGPRDLVAVFSPMEGTYIVFADPNVEAICLNNWDTDSDGFLSYDEAAAVTNLGQVFYYNRNITSFDELQYFTGLTYINEYEFEYCENLTSVILPQNVTSIGYAAFGSCHNLTGEFVIPNSVTYIGANAFYNCNSLTSIIIPDGITSIEEGVFDWCSSLETINLPNSVETIGNWAFYGCTSLTNLILPSSLTSIGYKAFSDCRSLSGTLEIPMLVTSIEDEAFRNCTSLTGLVLPENLQYIGSRAFQNCSGLRGEITLPETLESVGGYAFYGCDGISVVNYNATNCQTMGSAGEPVFYDCAFSHLRIGENVESIPDFAFKHCFLINDISSGAVTPPTIYSSTFGMVSRNIPVSVPMGSGEAYRTAPYWEEFFHITEDYSPNSYTYHWNVNIHQFETNMTVTGIIQIEGVEQAVPYLEIGAFCNGECRGRQLLTYYPEVDRYLVFLMLYGETGDMFNFKLYNHETNEESVAGCVSVVTFEPNAIVGTFEDPFVFNFTNMQLTQFYQGWNWWSTYIEQEGIDGLTMLEEGLGSNGFQIKSQTDYVTNYGTMWFGMLSSITNEETYMVNNTADCIVAMPGMPATPSDHPINISNGWNWIGYPCTNTMSVSEAFAGLESTNGDQVKSQADYAMYFNGVWFGQLQNITPGTGLMYMSNNTESTTLVYPDGSRNTEAATSAKATHWTNDIHAYPHNMTVMAVVELNDEELNSENYELAAFANGECRGSAKLTYVEPLNRYVAFLTIAGNDAVELGFRLYDAETGAEYYDAEESLSFAVNATIGEPEDVFVVHFRGTTGMDELASSVQVYPNPVNGGEQFSIGVNAESKAPVRVEIVNAMGVETLRATSTQMPAMLTAPSVAGVYTLRITVEGKGTIIRKLVVR